MALLLIIIYNVQFILKKKAAVTQTMNCFETNILF